MENVTLIIPIEATTVNILSNSSGVTAGVIAVAISVVALLNG